MNGVTKESMYKEPAAAFEKETLLVNPYGLSLPGRGSKSQTSKLLQSLIVLTIFWQTRLDLHAVLVLLW